MAEEERTPNLLSELVEKAYRLYLGGEYIEGFDNPYDFSAAINDALAGLGLGAKDILFTVAEQSLTTPEILGPFHEADIAEFDTWDRFLSYVMEKIVIEEMSVVHPEIYDIALERSMRFNKWRGSLK